MRRAHSYGRLQSWGPRDAVAKASSPKSKPQSRHDVSLAPEPARAPSQRAPRFHRVYGCKAYLGLLLGLDLFERKEFELFALDLVLEFELAVVRLVVLRLRGRPRGWLRTRVVSLGVRRR